MQTSIILLLFKNGEMAHLSGTKLSHITHREKSFDQKYKDGFDWDIRNSPSFFHQSKLSWHINTNDCCRFDTNLITQASRAKRPVSSLIKTLSWLNERITPGWASSIPNPFKKFPLLPITRRQILDCSKLKQFADDNFKFDENGIKFSK